MQEIGFWDYTCPLNGSLEAYSQADWDGLLDDMAAGGFNSLVLGVKWLTTGYRSRFSWLDQDQSCTAITSDNALIHHALAGARQRGIRVWLLVVATIFRTQAMDLPLGQPYWTDEYRVYDLDVPGIAERIELLFSEVLDLFGSQADGLIVELEFCDAEAPHRVPVYDAWARQNNRPSFAEIKDLRLEPRTYPYHHWRDFTTARRIDTFRQVEILARSKGFQGRLASIIEMDNQPGAVLSNVNMEMLGRQLPHWPVVTYDSIYDRRRNRLATIDLCVHQPRLAGLSPYYLTRGVMTFNIPPELPPTTLEAQWQMELEDAAAHRPDVLWFMGADCRRPDGLVCSSTLLPQWGFADARAARRRLIQMVNESGIQG